MNRISIDLKENYEKDLGSKKKHVMPAPKPFDISSSSKYILNFSFNIVANGEQCIDLVSKQVIVREIQYIIK